MAIENSSAVFGDPRLPARFWAKVRIHPVTGCWEWTGGNSGSTTAPYGRIRVGSRKDGTRRKTPAHRYAYERLIGPIPDDLPLDHFRFAGPGSPCVGPACVWPAHTRPATHHENVLRSTGPAARNLSKKCCPQGHAYDRVDGLGYRYCRKCVNEAQRRSKARRAPS